MRRDGACLAGAQSVAARGTLLAQREPLRLHTIHDARNLAWQQPPRDAGSGAFAAASTRAPLIGGEEQRRVLIRRILPLAAGRADVGHQCLDELGGEREGAPALLPLGLGIGHHEPPLLAAGMPLTLEI